MKYTLVITHWTWSGVICGVDVQHSDKCLDPVEMVELVPAVPTGASETVVSQSFSHDIANPFMMAVYEAKQHGKNEN